jgi:hypothetical protein
MLIGLSLVWSTISSGRSRWTDDQALQYQSISAELHGLSHAHHDEDDEHDEDHAVRLRAAQDKFDQLRSELGAARRRPQQIADVLQLVGIVLIALGVAAYYRQHLCGIA